jgi:hypothetical protein
MSWIYNEDGALKLKLQGLQVIDANAPSGRTVPVRFRLPEDELASLSYPIVILEHLPASFAPERQSRGYVPLPYSPEGEPIWWDPAALNFDPTLSPYWSYWPLAYNLDYKVTIYARKMVEHIQPLVAQLTAESYLPAQMGFLNVPQDGSFRNLFLMQGPIIEYGKDQDDKRLLRASYMIRVMSETIPTVFVNGFYGTLVSDITLDLGCYSSVEVLTTEELSANKALISTGPTLEFNVGFVAPPAPPPGRLEPMPIRSIPRRTHARGIWR